MKRADLCGVALMVIATRLCHSGVLWIEECYPAAAAIQILHGKLPYRDFWFDKPPLAPAFYVLFGALAGWPLRVAGSLVVIALAWLAGKFAGELWGEKEGRLAAWLFAVALTFWISAAVIPLAPDLLLLGPHLSAAYLAWKNRPALSGMMAGLAMLLHPKGAFVLLVALLWQWRNATRLAWGFALPHLFLAGVLILTGAWTGYVEQVWRWGRLYSTDTFLANPVQEGLRRTANWAGFHAAIVAGAWICWQRNGVMRVRLLLWTILALGSIVAGLRFFPRYYLQLLPPLVLAASRGIARLSPRKRWALLGLLLVPVARFGPRYFELGSAWLGKRPSEWRDLAMYYSSHEVARWIRHRAQPTDTILVWGYRPDILVETRLRLGAPFLDSQPLTGVIADRHLFDSRSSAPELAARNRQRLRQYWPVWVVDGLGPYNPRLAITEFGDLHDWLGHYERVARIPGATIYRISDSSSRAGASPGKQ